MENTAINGRYRILQQIGVGGFGLTFLAEDLHLPTRPRCVVKHLKPQITDPESLRLAGHLFQQEAEILYRLASHPCIPNLLAHFGENGEFYLVQEFIEGNTLAQEVFGGKRYNQKEIIQLLGQTLEILSFVHAQKVIHRDIKPANLIRRRADGSIFLIDFGAVKLVNPVPRSDSHDTFSVVAIGSHGYMPVEQLAGNPNFSSDLYALGLIAIELLTGIKPFDLQKNSNTNEFVWSHKIQLSTEVEQFITKLVRYDFRQRFFTANDALAALNTVAANVGFFNQPPPRGVQTSVQAAAHNQHFPPQNFPVPPAQIPPTIIVPANHRTTIGGRQNLSKPQMNAPRQSYAVSPIRSHDVPANTNVLRWIFWSVSGLTVFVLALYAVNLSVSPTGKSVVSVENEKNKREKAGKGPSSKPDLVQTKTLDAYLEAIEQAEEAKAKEKNATTKYEWQEIGNQYKRAYLLLSSIEQTHPNYTDAQATISSFKEKSEAAYQKSLEARERP